jgi:hypothetical protein
MARTSAAVGELVKDLALEPAARSDVQARVTRYNRDCGCALGGVFTIASLLMVIAYMAVTVSFTFAVVGAGVAFVIFFSMLGKAAGLAIASVRLELLRRSLSRRARRREEDNRVLVH